MNETNQFDILDFGEPEKEKSIIKVIGVGGGGGNAVNHMYREGIHDVTFVLCNTDNQALNDSPVPVHLQLGKRDWEPATNPNGPVRPLRKASKTYATCSTTALAWPLSRPVWVEEQAPEQRPSLPASRKT